MILSKCVLHKYVIVLSTLKEEKYLLLMNSGVALISLFSIIFILLIILTPVYFPSIKAFFTKPDRSSINSNEKYNTHANKDKIQEIIPLVFFQLEHKATRPVLLDH